MNYIPDSVYLVCESNCGICDNRVYSNVVNGFVTDSQRGKVFCPFGMSNSMNSGIFEDQSFINNQQTQTWKTSTWGHVPQMDPRPLAKIGLTWRTS
jgi:hypothetical protein